MIVANQVSKQYGAAHALRDVSFGCERGRVTGLLGPNGAGKSTMMRIMVGLSRPSAGAVTFDGVPYVQLPSPGHVVGVMLDAGAQHGGRTGAEVLTLGARSLGLPTRRVKEVLDLVGLSTAEAKRRVRAYSLGMRQRLGIAHALLANPEVLIFDEPANGLDPSGIRWIRQLLADHAQAGGTVLLSSHLIHEVELVADDLVLIGDGRVLATGTKQDLLNDLTSTSTQVDSDDNRALAGALAAAGHQARPDGIGLTVNAEPAAVGAVAAAQRIALKHLSRAAGSSLEEEFFRLTSGTARESVGGSAAVPDLDPSSRQHDNNLTGAVR
ncbi:ATP-binding cassette domain-containing protein [Microlunatus elymi]|uniref:ATP-binding cassette domain-containing protein n=1 Tax=Microlunatus elymi TaxID=2596828 RepID=A0A516PV84_9ACTN|nr:ATP-binding cassette domain-containing protein [Microlunatus elymi]QDP95107.1 ATP-binding cassette domain-containing protein [Microlunatus elymi]